MAIEPCEDCGATEGVRYFGTDYTPLCPRHYRQAERNVAAAERDGDRAALLAEVGRLRAALARALAVPDYGTVLPWCAADGRVVGSECLYCRQATRDEDAIDHAADCPVRVLEEG